MMTLQPMLMLALARHRKDRGACDFKPGHARKIAQPPTLSSLVLGDEQFPPATLPILSLHPMRAAVFALLPHTSELHGHVKFIMWVRLHNTRGPI